MRRKQRPSASKQAARRRIPLVCLGLALGFAATASAGVGQWTSTGPDGGSVTALAINPANPSNMYAGTSAGLFVSQDAGATWALSSGVGPGVASIAIDDTGEVLYAAAGNQNLASSDGGATWSRGERFDSVTVVAIDSRNPSTLYVGNAYGVVYRSADAGKSYSSGVGAIATINSIAVVPGTATTAYVSEPMGIFKTVDGGLSWTALTSLDAALGPKTYNQYFVAIDPGDPQGIYAARSSETGSHLCSSSDGGTTWGCGGNVQGPVVALAFEHRESHLTIYAAISAGVVYASVDRGSTWSERHDGLGGDPYALAVTPDGATLFAGTAEGVYRSGDQAGRWNSSSVGLHATTILALATAPTGPESLMAGTDFGHLFGRADGEGWRTLGVTGSSRFLDSIKAIAVSPEDPVTAYAGGYPGIVKTSDGFAHGDLSTFSHAVHAIAIDPEAPTNVYAGTGGGFKHNGGVSRSTDGGATWNPTSLAHEVYSLIIDPKHPSTLYAGTDRDYGYYTTGGGIFKSTDAGETWALADKRFGNRILALAIDPRNSSTIFAGMRSYGVYKSTDAAATWSYSGSSRFRDVYALLADPVVPDRLYAATEAGVWQSQDGGRTWGRLGLSGFPITSLAIDPDGSVLHAGTAGAGVYDYTFSPPGLCATGSLCLLGNRFEVSLYAVDAGRGLTTSGTAVAQNDRFGYFSLPAFTGDPALPEVVLKMVDATATPFRSFWFFYSSLTSLSYTVTVRDTITGQLRTYESDGYCGGADTSGFRADSTTGATSIEDETAETLAASGTELSLLSNRFRITLSARDSRQRKTSAGVAIPQDDRFGYFSLPDFTGDGSFPEVFVKMVDGRSMPGKAFWVFHTGLTSLSYTITVTDTVTGAVQTYNNSHSGASRFCGGADTSAFRDAP